MNLGTPELVIIALLLMVVVGIGATVWGIVDASQRGQTGWVVAIAISWGFGIGWLVAVVYLTAVRPGLERASRPPAPPGPAPNPFDRGWG